MEIILSSSGLDHEPSSESSATCPRTLLFVVEQRFHRTPDGMVWTTGHYPYSFFHRYLRTFDEVRVLSRVIGASARPADAAISGGPGVTHVGLPDYRGLSGLLTRAPGAAVRSIAAARTADAVIVRSPSSWGMLPCIVARMLGRPVGVEVIGDPQAVFAPGVLSHPMRPLIQAAAARLQARLCRDADAVMYVSEELRHRYRSSGGVFVGSDCALPHEAFVDRPRQCRSLVELRIINVGTFEQPYKGQDVLLRSVRQLRSAMDGLKLHVDFVGAGKHQANCVALSRELGLEREVTFHGHVSSAEKLRALLDAADVMVHPSRTEGMPRVVIEAMARGLPCIATRVGGIPELLDAECLVPPGDCDAIVRAIVALVRAPGRYADQSRRNLGASRSHSERLSEERYAHFLERVIRASR